MIQQASTTDENDPSIETDGSATGANGQATGTSGSSLLPMSASDIRDNDIICGRGRHSKHPGNTSFLKLVLAHKAEYFEAKTRKEKNRIAQEIKDHIQTKLVPNGRFIQLISGEHGEEDAEFEEVDDVVAMDKIKQALRQKHKGWECQQDQSTSKDTDVNNIVPQPGFGMSGNNAIFGGINLQQTLEGAQQPGPDFEQLSSLLQQQQQLLQQQLQQQQPQQQLPNSNSLMGAAGMAGLSFLLQQQYPQQSNMFNFGDWTALGPKQGAATPASAPNPFGGLFPQLGIGGAANQNNAPTSIAFDPSSFLIQTPQINNGLLGPIQQLQSQHQPQVQQQAPDAAALSSAISAAGSGPPTADGATTKQWDQSTLVIFIKTALSVVSGMKAIHEGNAEGTDFSLDLYNLGCTLSKLLTGDEKKDNDVDQPPNSKRRRFDEASRSLNDAGVPSALEDFITSLINSKGSGDTSSSKYNFKSIQEVEFLLQQMVAEPGQYLFGAGAGGGSSLEVEEALL